MQGVQLRKYGVEFTVDFELYEVDGVDLRVDWVPAQSDCEIMKDGGASTQCTNTATDEGSTYSIIITATEAQASRLVLKVVDAATKVFLDKVVVIETYGHASAQHAFDLDTASVAQTADHTAGIAAIPTTAMRGTDSAALASVCTEGRLAELDAGNLPTDIAAIPTTAMRGTDGANTVVPDAAGVAPTAVENRQEMDSNSTELAKIGTIPALDGAGQTIGAAIAKIADDNAGADFDSSEHSLKGIKDQINQVANISGQAKKAPSTYVLTTGTQSANTVTSTEELDGTRHEHTDTAGVMDLYYEFEVGASIPTDIIVTGYLQGNNDDLEVYGYDWVSASWKQIGTLGGQASALNAVNEYNLLVNMVGSGANEGKVRVRFTDGAFTLTTATLAIDQILVVFSVGDGAYENGAIWLDTNASNTNTVRGVDGRASNPVSTMAAVNTLLASANLNRVEVAPASSVTFAANQDSQQFTGKNWTLALGGQSISGTYIEGADVSGIGTGATHPHFDHCHFDNVTLPPCDNESCVFGGTFTMGTAGDFFFEACLSGVAGVSTPILDFGAAIGASNINMRAYSGGIELQNMAASDTMSLEGWGQVIANANCSGGAVSIRGAFSTSGAGLSNLTVTEDARFNVSQNIGIDWSNVSNPTTALGLSGTDIQLVDTASTVTDGAKEAKQDIAQTDLDTITGADGVTISTAAAAQLVIDNWDRVLNAANHNIPSSAGRRVRNLEDTVIITGTSPDTGGTANTTIRIELDVDASSMDGAYDPSVISITEGTGAGQSRQIWEYDGTNKYAYINRDWKIVPDNTSKYIITSDSGDTHINEGLAQAGTSTSLTLNTLASTDDNTYNGQIIFLAAGVGQDQRRTVLGYVGATKVATVRTWDTTPTGGVGTIYAMLPKEDTWERSLPGNYPAGSAGYIVGTNLDAKSSDIETDTAEIGAAGAGLTAIPKTGYKLASDGLDSVSTTAPTGPASNFREMLVQTWRRFFKKAVKDDNASTIETFADNGTTVITTQAISDVANVETQGPAT